MRIISGNFKGKKILRPLLDLKKNDLVFVAKNVFNFVNNLFDKENKSFNINMDDEIIEKTMVK